VTATMRPYDPGPGPAPRLALWSFGLGLAGVVCGLTAPFALAAGVVALRRLEGTGEAGRPWALAGIALSIPGILWLVVGAVVLLDRTLTLTTW